MIMVLKPQRYKISLTSLFNCDDKKLRFKPCDTVKDGI